MRIFLNSSNKKSLNTKTLKVLLLLFLAADCCRNSTSAQEIFTSKNLPAPSIPFRQCWEGNEDDLTTNEIASDNAGAIYVSTSNGKLKSYDSRSGGKFWEVDLGGKIISPARLSEEEKNLYIVTRSTSTLTLKLWSLSKVTGLTNWQVSIDGGIFDKTQTAKLFVSDRKIILGGQNGSIASFNKRDGGMNWTKSLGADLTAQPFYFENDLYLASASAKLFILSVESGHFVYEAQMKSPITAIFLNGKKTLFLGNERGEVLAAETPAGKQLWKTRAGAKISNLTQTKEGLLVTSFDNFIYLIGTGDGKKVWKKRLGNRIEEEPLVVNQYVIIVSAGSSTVSIIDLASGGISSQIYQFDGGSFTLRSIYVGGIVVFSTSNGLHAFADLSSSPGQCSVLQQAKRG